jgi:hypothetical protein
MPEEPPTPEESLGSGPKLTTIGDYDFDGDRQPDVARPFPWDLAVDSASGDLATTSGEENLQQRLAFRSALTLGKHIGARATGDKLGEIESEAKSVLENDAAVSRVAEAEASQSTTRLQTIEGGRYVGVDWGRTVEVVAEVYDTRDERHELVFPVFR